MKINSLAYVLAVVLLGCSITIGQEKETLPPLKNNESPKNFDEMWAGFDPRAEPLEIETVQEWEEEDVVMRIVRFRIGVFKGKKALLAAIYGFPKDAVAGGKKLPGLVQIHGGGQYADHKACLANAKRGYATVSIAWAGRISAPGYHVDPGVVKLFWDNKTEDPNYKLTTDWGAVDGYHAPGRNPKNQFPVIAPADFTLDAVESPRNSGWFLCALAARRALTFLERQPEVDANKLGVYGHSMGGKLTVMTAVDSRVKAAAPSCGGISDRDNKSELFRKTVGDDVSLKQITCPIVFLSPANDFHGRIGDLPAAVSEIQSKDWRVTCSPHHNHQDTAEYEVAALLWFDQHLKDKFAFPQTPKSRLNLKTADRVPVFSVQPDPGKSILSVDIFYTQHGKADETPKDREDTMSRFWHHAKAVKANGTWSAKIPIANRDQPLWIYANINYPLSPTVSGVGYYYGAFTASKFNLSSLLQTASPAELKSADCRVTRKPTNLIESFEGDWEKEWFSYKSSPWSRTTYKLHDETWKAPSNATLVFRIRAAEANKLVVMFDQFATVVEVEGGNQWQTIQLSSSDLKDFEGGSLGSWNDVTTMKLSAAEWLKPKSRGGQAKPRLLGKHWKGTLPEFQEMRWVQKVESKK